MSAQLQVTGEAKIRDIQGPVVANSGVITALDGAASQYVRGDGTLADFPTSTGGGSSVSYYLNSSVSQGTIGGVAYRELSKEPIIGAGTDIAISANGYVANYLTDANDPDVLSIPGGNFNCEFYFSVNNNTGNPTFYAELYKYDGTTFTLLGTSAGVPESINQGTTIAPYYFAIPVATAALSVTDRLAIRIYVNVSGRTITLHTENGHLCQVVTTLSKGMVSLNNLTDQSQYLATGTSGTNFAIVSSGDTHTFNLPVASAANTGKLSSTDWSTFNGKVPYTGATGSVDLGIYSLSAGELNIKKNGSLTSAINFEQATGTSIAGAGYTSIGPIGTDGVTFFFGGGTNSLTFKNNLLTSSRTYSLPDASGTLALTSNLSSYVPYTGATGSVDLGVYNLTSNLQYNKGIIVNKSSTTANSLNIEIAASASISGVGYISLTSIATDSLSVYFGGSTKVAILSGSSLSANRTFTLPDITGTLALLEGTQTFTGVKSFDTGILLKNGVITTTSGYTGIGASTSGINISLGAGGGGSLTFQSTGYNYTFPASSGTLALTSDLGAYVTLATNQTISGAKTFSTSFVASNYAEFSLGGLVYFNGSQLFNRGISFSDTGSPSIFADAQAFYVNRSGTTSTIVVRRDNVSGSSYAQTLSFSNNAANRTYTFPDANGTLALTSNLSAYLPLTGGTLTGALTTNGITNGDGTADTRIVTRPNTPFALGVQNSTTSNVYYLGVASSAATANFQIYNTFTAASIFSMTYQGAATFSSSVTAGGLITKTAGSAAALLMNDTSGNNKWEMGWEATSNNFYIYSYGGGISPFRITSGGNVGINTSTPSSFGNYTNFTIKGGSSGANLDLYNSANTRSANFVLNGTASAYIGTVNDIPFDITQNDVTRIRVASGGNVGIGTSSPAAGYLLDVYGTATFGASTTTGNKVHIGSGAVPSGAAGIGLWATGSNLFSIVGLGDTTIDSRGSYLIINPNGGNVGIGTSSPSYQLQLGADSAAKPTSALWTIASDKRIKENIIPYSKGLQELLNINPVTYDYNGLGGFAKGKGGVGIIAQEIIDILPDSVSSIKGKLNETDEEEIDILNFNGHELIYVLINAIKELKAEIDELKNK